jgi:hypothetical protein
MPMPVSVTEISAAPFCAGADVDPPPSGVNWRWSAG